MTTSQAMGTNKYIIPTHIHTFAHFTMTSVKRKILLNYRLYISPHLQQAYHIIHYRNFIYLGH